MGDRVKYNDELRTTQLNHGIAVRGHKNAMIEHDKDLKRLAYKEDVLKVINNLNQLINSLIIN